MTIAYVLELILEVAVAMGATRYAMVWIRGMAGVRVSQALYTGEDWVYASIFLAALGIAGSIGLIGELARKRSPERWGEGRWVWSLAGVFQVLVILKSTAVLFPINRPNDLLLLLHSMAAWSNFAPILIALWVTARTARVSLPATRDGREWAGRIFALIVVAQWIVEMAQHWWLKLLD